MVSRNQKKVKAQNRAKPALKLLCARSKGVSSWTMTEASVAVWESGKGVLCSARWEMGSSMNLRPSKSYIHNKNKWIRKIYTIPKSRRQEHLFNSTWPLEKINLPWELVTPDLISHRFGIQMYIAFTIRKSPTLRIKLKWVLIKNTWGILA